MIVKVEPTTRHKSMLAVHGMHQMEKTHRPLEPKDIRRMRQKYDVSIKDLALELDTYERWVIGAEQGKEDVSPWTLVSICTSILGIFIDRCIQGDQNRDKAEEGNESGYSEFDG